MSFRRMRHVKAREVQGCTLALDAGVPSMYDATSGGSLVASDGSIYRWEDQSGNGNHVTQGSGSSYCPTRKTSEANNFGAALFDGSNDSLASATSNYSNFFGATESTVIATVKQNSSKLENSLLSAATSSTSAGFQFWATYSDALYFDSPNVSARVTTSQPTGWDNTYNIATGKRNGGTALIRVNSKELISQTGKTGSLSYTATALTVGHAPTVGGSPYFSGHISMVSVFKVALSAYVTLRMEHLAARKIRIKSA